MEIDLTHTILGWHFTERKHAFFGGRTIPKNNRWLVTRQTPVICQQGLHFSRHAIDALRYAPGVFAHRVEIAGVGEEHGNKGVACARRIIARCNAKQVLRDFARMCAGDVLHLWDAPKVVKEWIETGNESLRDAAARAARDAAWDADFAADATRSAIGAATWPVWKAARAAADAAWAADRSAAAAAWAADRSAAAARAAQNARLESMLLEACK